MLKSETDNLKKLVLNLDPDQLTAASTVGYFGELRSEVTRECERVVGVWALLLQSAVRDEVLSRYVPFQEQNLLEMLDQANRWIAEDAFRVHPESQTEHYYACLNYLISKLLELNDFLFKYFASYFNLDSKLPGAALPKTIIKINRSAADIQTAFKSVLFDEELKSCIQVYLSDFECLNNHRPITYRSLAYFNNYTNLLLFILEHHNQRDLTERICEAMLYINFNCNAFFLWYQRRIAKKQNNIAKANEKMLMLVEEMIFVKTIPVLASSSYEPDLEPVNVLISNWINELINKENKFLDLRGAKLPLTITVPQLSLLTRLLYDEGIFGIRNISEILRFFAACFSSKKQGEISAESMRKSFYGKDPFTAASVKDLLSGMLEKVNRLIILSG